MNFTTIFKAASRAGLAGVLALGLSAGVVPGAQAAVQTGTVIRDNHARVVLVFPPYFTLNGFPLYGFYGAPSLYDYTSIPQPDQNIQPSPGAGDYGPHFYSHESTAPHFFE
jgi:hypothetical protein